MLINVDNKNTISTEFCESFYKDDSINKQILYDDKDDRIGHKLANADLIGIPIQIVVGERNLINENIEIRERISGKTHIINKGQIIKFLERFYVK